MRYLLESPTTGVRVPLNSGIKFGRALDASTKAIPFLSLLFANPSLESSVYKSRIYLSYSAKLGCLVLFFSIKQKS